MQTKFYTPTGQPVQLQPDKKGKYKGRYNLCQIFDMGFADFQLTPGFNYILLTREQCIAIDNQTDGLCSADNHNQWWAQRKAIIMAEAAKYGID